MSHRFTRIVKICAETTQRMPNWPHHHYLDPDSPPMPTPSVPPTVTPFSCPPVLPKASFSVLRHSYWLVGWRTALYTQNKDTLKTLGLNTTTSMPFQHQRHAQPRRASGQFLRRRKLLQLVYAGPTEKTRSRRRRVPTTYGFIRHKHGVLLWLTPRTCRNTRDT